MKLKVASYATCPPEQQSIVENRLINKVKSFKGLYVVDISVKSGMVADDFVRNRFTVIVQGFAYYRKPRFIRPNYNNATNREGSKKYRKIIKRRYARRKNQHPYSL